MIVSPGRILVCVAAALAAATDLPAAEAAAPDILRSLTGLDAKDAAVPIRALLLVTVFGLAPSILLLTTCFPRIFIVLTFLRRAIGAPDIPSNAIMAGFALLLTGIVMLPVWKRVHDDAYVPLVRGELASTDEALVRAGGPLKKFMLAHTLQKDLRLFVELSRRGGEAAGSGGGAAGTAAPRVEKVEDLGFLVILPAFVLSELKLAFQVGFLLYLPFLVIDLAVSAVLISMGMFMLPPVFVSLPLKVLVFVIVDGWNLIVTQLVQGFKVVA